MIVHDPKVSTDKSFLTIALDFAISDIPRASVNVNTAGRPSGIAATASETAVMNVSTRGIPFKNSMMNMAIHTTIAIADKVFPSFPTRFARGVSSSSSWTMSAIFPISVAIPMFSTTPSPFPERMLESM